VTVHFPNGPVTGALADGTTFVLMARGVVVEGALLDLVDLAPSTICVEWSTPRTVSYVTTGQFLDLWWTARADSALARFGLLSASLVRCEPIQLQLRQPRIVGSGLRWTVTDVRGLLPHESGACVLVINPPGSVERDVSSRG